jgi:hypothetical protein
VPASTELDRILALPRRDDDRDVSEVVRLLTEHLRTPTGTQVLWPEQALALVDLHDYLGLFAPITVGRGKSLITLLAGTVLKAKRTVLLVPKSLVRKTETEALEYAKHWRITMPTILGYEMLSHKNHVEDLERLRPDLLLADEAHKLRNVNVACTRRVGRYLHDHPKTVFASMSGTLIGRSLVHYQHLLNATHGDRSPLPRTMAETKRWAQAIDEEPPNDLDIRLDVGALSVFGTTHDEARVGLSRWIRDTPGVVASTGTDVDASIQISRWCPSVPAECQRLIDAVANPEPGMGHTRPDGFEIREAEVTNCLSQLALGFFYIWDPLPPEEWLTARKEWYRFVRETVEEKIPGLDTEATIKVALGTMDQPCPELQAWEAVRKSFEPNKVPIWVDKDVLRQAAAFADDTDGCVIWSRYRAVGEAFAEMNIPHFGEGGVDQNGVPIEQTQQTVVSASIAANATGRNLQRWYRALALTVSSNAEIWEQKIGRMHREGQRADTVLISVIQATDAHARALEAARKHAEHLRKMSGTDKKLLLADWL